MRLSGSHHLYTASRGIQTSKFHKCDFILKFSLQLCKGLTLWPVQSVFREAPTNNSSISDIGFCDDFKFELDYTIQTDPDVPEFTVKSTGISPNAFRLKHKGKYSFVGDHNIRVGNYAKWVQNASFMACMVGPIKKFPVVNAKIHFDSICLVSDDTLTNVVKDYKFNINGIQFQRNKLLKIIYGSIF